MKKQILLKDTELESLTRKTIVEFREISKAEQNPMFEDLSDQVRTKEEEIQILWNVIKEINKQKGGTLNIAQLKKLIQKSELVTKQADYQMGLFATPNPLRY